MDAAAWMAGRMYFRGRSLNPSGLGAGFASALEAAATRVLPDLYPHFVVTDLVPSELLQLVEGELSGPSPKLLTGDLGILEVDKGRYVPTCSGVVPKRVQEHVEAEGGLSGASLVTHFGGPPYGYTANVVKACTAGLLRAGKVRIQPEGIAEITAVRDAGVRELFEKDRTFRRASLFPAGDDDIGFQSRARICKFFEEHLGHVMDRQDDAIADAAASLFPQQAQRLRGVLLQLDRLPGSPETPAVLTKLADALEQSLRFVRQTRPTVKLVKKNLDALRDGIQLTNIYESELTPAAVELVKEAANVRDYQAAQLQETGALESGLDESV